MRQGVFRSSLAIAATIGAAIVAADQLTKWLVLEVVMQPPRVIEVTGFLNLVLVHNPGISFGLLGGQSAWKTWLLSVLALGVVAALMVWVRGRRETAPRIAAGMVSGGAIGNAIDRLRFGSVVDFVDLHAGAWHWPAFNLADSAITLGVALLLVHGLFFDKRQGN